MVNFKGGGFRGCLVSALLLIIANPDARAAREFEHVGLAGGQVRFIPTDARAAAMGTAYTALAEGTSGAYWNMGALGISPQYSGLAVSDNDYLTGEDSELYSIDSYSGFEGFGVGLHMTQYKFESAIRTVDHPEGDGTYTVSEKIGLLGAGLNMRKLIPRLSQTMEWGVGIGLVFVDGGMSQSDYSNWDLDFGTQFIVDLPLAGPSALAGSPLSFRFGWTLRNATKGTLKQENKDFKLGRRDRAGLALEVKIAEDPQFGPLFEAVLAGERRKVFFGAYQGEDSIDQFGIEIRGAGIVSFRKGIIFDENNMGYDIDSWGIGIGLKPGNRISPNMGAQLDYTEVDYKVLGETEQFTVSGWIVF
ncbi:MAG: hypothetical protein KJ970_17835 [Candidatus Eisenbacteria bacterium]|uniref:PorV/PorQ family protein n=1 Tax=Eiseniibacteriota bacterium TaxID=2212470 RepID=A0A948W4Z9_UNCEI|nr:hypothetical protein [Candidatus Eisenbacteria bacterium]MBU1950828.1 hypothetical protein [Candidatus Eisenbacteria bacterium]MBU2692782.1 hypothetical protein [Candidatus Eisenbacteria bacterium]